LTATATSTTATLPPRHPDEAQRPSRFAFRLALLALAGLGIRLGYVLAGGGAGTSFDGAYYHLAANVLVDGRGFVNPFNGVPTALHPPAWPALLGLPSILGLDTLLAHQIFAGLVGAATVVAVGMAARVIAGATPGLIAAAITAVYPNLWVRERELAAETLVFPLVAITLILAYRFWVRPRTITFAALGGACAVLALVRAEQAFLLVLLLLPLAVRAGQGPALRRFLRFAAAAGVAVLVLLPWAVYNSTRFEEPVLLTTSFGVTARGANCPGAYDGAYLGSQHPDIWRPPASAGSSGCAWDAGSAEESEQDAEFREAALAYTRERAERLPAVVAAREGRTWGVFRPFQEAVFQQDWGLQPIGVYWAGLAAYWALLPFAVVGAAHLRRHRVRLWPLLSFQALTVVTVAITYGNVRFRAAAEVPLIVLAAVGADALWGRLRSHDRRAATNASTTSSAPAGVTSV
jgi:4-amino-4-deoxy-L-arabinose transferase-like glycosyltransferase